MAVMPDRNEGLAAILEQQVRLYMGVNTHELFVKSHRKLIENAYVSCWTREPDNIAMWLLYSPHKNAIRVSATIEKLKEVTKSELKKNLWTNHIESPEGTFQLVKAWVEDVKYTDFSKDIESIKSRFENYLDKLKDCSDFKEVIGSEDDFQQKDFSISDGSPLALKDRAYEHEKEVRAIFLGGVRSDVSSESWQAGRGLKSFLPTMRKALNGELPAVRYIAADDLIDDVCFDPRMPEYEKEVCIEALGLDGNSQKVTTSHVFGYIPDIYPFDFTD